MPGDINSPGDNPFFVGHHESDPLAGRTPAFPNGGGKLPPMDSVWRYLRKRDPLLTKHDKDLIAHELNNSGAMARFGKPDFEQRLLEVVEAVRHAKGRIISQYVASRWATGDIKNDIQEKDRD